MSSSSGNDETQEVEADMKAINAAIQYKTAMMADQRKKLAAAKVSEESVDGVYLAPNIFSKNTTGSLIVQLNALCKKDVYCVDKITAILNNLLVIYV